MENPSTRRGRVSGYRQQLLQLGKERPVREVGNYTFEGATEAARALFKRRSRPDAIFCANDHMALAAIEVARSEFGLEVGRDVSIIGFDDIAMAAWPSHSRSEEHTSELQSLMRISYAVF